MNEGRNERLRGEARKLRVPRVWQWTALVVGGAAMVMGTLRAARATGIPSSGALVYSGILTDSAGNPLPSPQSVAVAVYDAVTAGNKVCEQPAQMVAVDPGGRFQVNMPDTCATAVGNQANLWVEVSVAGSSLGRSKIGAVPYAIEANDATTLQGKSPAQLAVPSGMIGMFATACPSGWSICDGTNGTPNLIDSYVKGGSTFAASVGSNTHSHAITGATSSNGHHYHFVEFTWDYGSSTPMGAESLFGNYRPFDSTVVDDQYVSSSRWGATGRLDIPGASGHSETAYTLNAGIVTTSVGDHTHTVTGTTDAQNHEPRHATVIFCMKN